jgi:hypothetical protein
LENRHNFPESHRQSLQLIHDPCPHLHQPMPVPKQLPQITIVRTRYPNEGQRWKKKLWNEQGRAQLEKLPLAPWASRRRQDLVEQLRRQASIHSR